MGSLWILCSPRLSQPSFRRYRGDARDQRSLLKNLHISSYDDLISQSGRPPSVRSSAEMSFRHTQAVSLNGWYADVSHTFTTSRHS
jgi:hypothetical protein